MAAIRRPDLAATAGRQRAPPPAVQSNQQMAIYQDVLIVRGNRKIAGPQHAIRELKVQRKLGGLRDRVVADLQPDERRASILRPPQTDHASVAGQRSRPIVSRVGYLTFPMTGQQAQVAVSQYQDPSGTDRSGVCGGGVPRD